MKTYISILRGINVSGKNIIKMNILKRIYEYLNFQNIITYLQSGNVIFNSEETDHKIIEKNISSLIEKETGLKIPVIILTIEEWKDSIENNPFRKEKEEAFLHFTFLAENPKDFNLEKIKSKKSENEDIEIIEKVVYLYCPNGYGKTKLTNTFLENNLKVTATTRNFKTTKSLLEIAENIR